MDQPVDVARRSADREDSLVEMFAALALIAPDQDTVGHVLGLALELEPQDEPAPTIDEPLAGAPNL